MPLSLESFMGSSAMQDELLKALASSAAGGTDASPLIKEDLEVEAHTQLWLETDPVELVILKHLARIPAFSVLHQFDRIVGYGPQGTTGFYGESSLPPEAAIQSVRDTATIRLMGLISSVFALASFQTPIQALGQANLVDQNMASTRLALLHLMAQQVYGSNTDTSLDGIRFKGIQQQILEGTSPSTSSPFTVNSDYIIDLRGGKLLPEEVRKRGRQVVERFGQLRWIYLAPSVKEFLEASLDPAERLQLPRAAGEAVILGQNVDGMNTAGGITRFAVDNTLTSLLYTGTAPVASVSGAPTPLPGGNLAAPSAGADPAAVPLWTAVDANADVIYDFTAMNAFGESTATRVGPVAVAAGQRVTIAVTPRAADTSYKVYRGIDGAVTAPQFIREIKGTGNTTPFNFIDANQRIPGTTEAYGLNVASANADLFRTTMDVEAVRNRISLANPARARNTITLATLGPWMGIFDLAHILHTASRDLLFSAFSPILTHPFQNVVWINCGDRDL
jgi:hypothetical protein